MEVEGGDGIKGLTRLGWHTVLGHAVLPGLSVCSVLSMCVSACVPATEERIAHAFALWLVRPTVGCICSAADIGAAVQ